MTSTPLSKTWECPATRFKTLSVLQVLPCFLKVFKLLLKHKSEPLPGNDIPKVPEFKSQVLGVPKIPDIDENTPNYVYPWMPSISAARKKDAEIKRAREQEAKKAG